MKNINEYIKAPDICMGRIVNKETGKFLDFECVGLNLDGFTVEGSIDVVKGNHDFYGAASFLSEIMLPVPMEVSIIGRPPFVGVFADDMDGGVVGLATRLEREYGGVCPVETIRFKLTLLETGVDRTNEGKEVSQ